MVLLKGIDPHGFVFFTNYDSRKGQELLAQEMGGDSALVFWWPHLQRQVRVEGKSKKLPEDESDAYFASRPRGSQLGAHVSPQVSYSQ